jgi:hypothetical protein
MTTLTKPVRRVSGSLIHEQGRNRAIVVLLRPPNVIGFRAAGCRREYQLTIEGCYTMAVRAYVAAAQRERIKARKLKRQERR